MSRSIEVWRPHAEGLLSTLEESEAHARRLERMGAKLHPLEGSTLFAAAAWIRVVNKDIRIALGEKQEARNAS